MHGYRRIYLLVYKTYSFNRTRRLTRCLCVSGVGDVRPDERDIFHRGRVLRFVLSDQPDVGRSRSEL